MLRILHLIETSGPGGAETVLLNLVTGLDGERFFSIVGMLKEGWLYSQLRARSVAVRLLETGGSLDVRLLQGLVRLIREGDVDLVHSHLLDMSFYAAIAARLTRVPHIMTEHGDIHHVSKKRTMMSLKARVAASLSTRTVAVSRYTKEAFLRSTGISARKVHVVYNGVPAAAPPFDVDRAGKRAELGLDGNDFVVGTTGNLYAVKGHVHLLRAARDVVRECRNVKFLILGRGELLEHLQEQSAELGIARNVLFLGFRPDVSDILKIVDLFVLPSLSESFSLAVLEAMSAGKPVIATRCGGPEEIVVDGETGFLVRPGSSEELADRIIHLMKNPELAETMGRRGSQRAHTVFSTRAMIEAYQALYEHCSRKVARGEGVHS